jgi:hypothetical protein
MSNRDIMRRSFFAGLCFLVLAGCATPVDNAYIARMNGLVGQSERDLISAWGVPDKTYQLDNGTRVLTYARGSTRLIGSGFSTSACAGGAWPSLGYNSCLGGFPEMQSVTYYCDYSFNVSRGRVQGWFQNGNDCPRIQ